MNKIIQSDRLILRPIESEDHERIFYGLSHPDVIKYYGVSFSTLEATKEQMDWYANLEKNELGLWWAVCHKEMGKFLGAGGLNDVSRKHKKAEIGFWLLPDYWGNGYMTEAMPLICSFAFNEMGLHRIEGFVQSDNTACKKALAKLNFEHEGTMRECEHKDEVFISIDIYSCLNPK